MEEFNTILGEISSALWGWPMIILLLGTHIFLTVRLRFPQRKIFTAIKISVKKIQTQLEMSLNMVLWQLLLPLQ